ncbi:MAG: hypothetical protein QM484_14870 [Woeseiaceae bacterium]
MKILETEDIKEIISRNTTDDLGPRNEAALLMATLLGLTASELSQVTVSDMLNARGEIRKTLVITPGISFNGNERDVPINHSRLIEALERYIVMLIARQWSIVKSKRYKRLDPKREFLLNDMGKPFAMSLRSKNSSKRQPTGMNTLFRNLIGRTKYKGKVTYTDFRRSYIVHRARPDEGGLSIRDLMEVSGIRDYHSVKKIVDMDTRTIRKAVKGIYKRL